MPHLESASLRGSQDHLYQVGTSEGVPGLDNVLDALEKEGQEATSDIAARANARGIEATTADRQGHPPDDILSYAEENDIGVIVMETHGRTGVKRALLGSVTEDAVRHFDIPVLAVYREMDA